MYPRLGSIPIQPPTIRIPGHPIHDRPTRRAGLVDLQPDVIVHARNGMIVLMNDEVTAVWMLVSSVEGLEGGD